MRQSIAALLIMALWAAPAAASPPDACALFRIDYVRSHTAYILFRQNLGDRGAIIPPMGDALSAWMQGRAAEADRLLDEATRWPETEDNRRAVHALRLLLDLLRSCDPDGRLKLEFRPGPRSVG